jgi:gliding motility-associated-like protein
MDCLMKLLLPFVSIITTAFFAGVPLPMGVEICENAFDDDGDGLIDLNDPDCHCPLAVPESLIPNPSFEDQLCCPSGRSQLDCAVAWIQASTPTTDYLHTCGWLGWDDLPVPLPLPDGSGCVGFRNGRPGNVNGDPPNPNWKEYAGACLTHPLKKGVEYRFEFNIGFTHSINSPPLRIVFYGTNDCANLPFGNGDETFGCPTNGPGWFELGSLYANGANSWDQGTITVTPTGDIHAIAIGPDCVEVPSTVSLYYFFDNLVLATKQEFEYNISMIGHPCSPDMAFRVPYSDTLFYQWYWNGVAIVGETSPNLPGLKKNGHYEVRLVGPNSCRVTRSFHFAKPVEQSNKKQVICQGQSYRFNNKDLSNAGIYYDTLSTVDGCDSIIRLDLYVASDVRDTVVVKIFENEYFKVGNSSFRKPGKYDVRLVSFFGCDSLVHLSLDWYKVFIPNAFSPNGDGFNDHFTILAGDDVQEVINLRVFDRWGGMVYASNGLTPNDFPAGWDGTHQGKPVQPGAYTYKTDILFDDGKARELMGTVNVLR